MRPMAVILVTLASLVAAAPAAGAACEVLVEAESFAERGGWVVDQQFMDIMGSPYLLAHGMGRPVAPARTQAQFPEPGAYRLWVRTKDWIPEHHPGRFKVVIDGVPAAAVFGRKGKGWIWQDGGTVEVRGRKAWVELADLTGFEGRCDALYFTTDAKAEPPNEPGKAMDAWRRRLLRLPAVPPSAGGFDAVVVGGGIAGTSAAIAAARMGCKVALVQDRPVLGGNASSEIRVHTGGQVGPNIVGEINAPYNKGAGAMPHPTLRFDQRRHAVVEAEKNITLFLNTHAFRARTEGGRIASVDGKHVVTAVELRFEAPVFVDCTGDGSIGYWAGAEYRVGREGRRAHDESIAPETPDKMTLGTSLMWGSVAGAEESTFPKVPWGVEVAKDMEAVQGNWTWEYGHYLDTIRDAEEIRDTMFCAIYGAFSNAKNGKDRAKHAKRQLSHVPYVGGKRESRRLIGDYVLTQGDLQATRQFPDGVATGSWSIDLHYPKDFKKYPFRTYAQFNKVKPYPIPFRCLYSINVENLMMAGRDVSVTHVALGSTRVMNTCGQMGVAVGAAAGLCKKHGTTPRGVYKNHLDEMLDILAGRGDHEGNLKPTGAAAQAAAMSVPDASGLEVGAVRKGAHRCTGGYTIAEMPDDLAGLPCVTVTRGSWQAPGAGYAFEVDGPATVYLAVHERGRANLPKEWQKTDMRIIWKTSNSKQVYTDRIFRRDVPPGKVRIPPHTGTDGTNYGLPHMAIVRGKDGAKVKVKPAAP